MKAFIACFALVLAGASSASSFDTMEAVRAGADNSFARLAPVRLKPKPAKSIVNLTGYLSMDGNGFVNQPNGGSVMITLQGSTNLSDPASGATATANFNETQTFFVNGNYVSGYVYPRQYVQVYRHGRMAGSVMVSGSIYVSGFVSGNWLRLSGSGQVSGSGSVQDK